MSRRTFPRVTAAGLLAVAVIASPPPAAAQSPNPWRNAAVETAPLPRPKDRSVEVEVYWNWTVNGPVYPSTSARFAEPPVPVAPPVATVPQFVTYPQPVPAPPAVIGVSGPGRLVAPPAPPMPAPPPPAPVPGVIVVRPTAPACVPPAPAFERIGVDFSTTPPTGAFVRPVPQAVVMAQPTAATLMRMSGTWYRELPGCVVAFTVRGDECHATITVNDNGTVAKVTLTTDCSMTKDGTVYGIITGADVDVSGAKESQGMELAELALQLQSVVDQPFAFRVRPTEGGLMVSSVRLPGGGPQEMCAMLAGKYKSAAYTAVPTPKPSKVGVCVPGRCDAGFNPADVILPVPCGPYPALPVAYPPGVFGPCPVPGPAAFAPPGGFGPPIQPWVTEQIEIKYAQPATYRGPVLPPVQCLPPMPATCPNPASCPIPCPASCPPATFEMMSRAFGQMLTAPQPVAGMTLPSPRYLQHPPQYFPPDPVFPLPRELASQAPEWTPRPAPAPTCPPTYCPAPYPTAVCPPTAPRPIVGITMTGGTPACVLPPPVIATGGYAPPPPPPAPPVNAAPPMLPPPALPGTVVQPPMVRGTTIVDPCWPERYTPAARCETRPVTGQAPNRGQPEKLTLLDVIDLSKAGCGDDVIINQIRKTGSTYDLNVKDIINLKKNGVGDAVIIELQGTPPAPPSQHLTPDRIHGGILYQADPNVRMQQLLQQSEDLQQIGSEWRRFWFSDRAN